MEVVADEERSILFSSHNTIDVEQISDRITFLDRGRIVDSDDKEAFVERWRRLHLELPESGGELELPALPGVVDVARSGRIAVVTANDYTPELAAACERAGATVRDVQRMTLEEIFVANVMHEQKGARRMNRPRTATLARRPPDRQRPLPLPLAHRRRPGSPGSSRSSSRASARATGRRRTRARTSASSCS